jgi:hypothetical protein
MPKNTDNLFVIEFLSDRDPEFTASMEEAVRRAEGSLRGAIVYKCVEVHKVVLTPPAK